MGGHVALQDRDRRVGIADKCPHHRLIAHQVLRRVDLRVIRAGAPERRHRAVSPARPPDHAGDDDLPNPAPERDLSRGREAIRLAREAPGAVDIELGVGDRHEPQLALGEAPAAGEAARPFPAPALCLPELRDVVCAPEQAVENRFRVAEIGVVVVCLPRLQHRRHDLLALIQEGAQRRMGGRQPRVESHRGFEVGLRAVEQGRATGWIGLRVQEPLDVAQAAAQLLGPRVSGISCQHLRRVPESDIDPPRRCRLVSERLSRATKGQLPALQRRFRPSWVGTLGGAEERIGDDVGSAGSVGLSILAGPFSTLHQRPCLFARRRRTLLPQPDFVTEPLAQGQRRLPSERVADRQPCGGGQLEGLPANVRAAGSVDEPNGHPHATAQILHVAFDERAGRERARNRVTRDVTAAERRDAAARHDIQRADAMELVDQCFGQPIGEIAKRAVVTLVAEVENGDAVAVETAQVASR